MKFVITNGNTYIMRSQENRLVSIQCIGEALFFDTEDAAMKAMCVLPKELKHKGYLIKKVVGVQLEGDRDFTFAESKEDDSDEEYEKEITKKTGRGVMFKIDDPDWLVDLKNDLLKADELLGKLPAINYQTSKELSKVNKELIDLEHAIEFLRPNAVQKCYLESEFKKARQKRRGLKDAKFMLDVVLNFRWIDWGSGKVPKMIKSMEEREYMPRVRKDLFE